MTNLTFAALRRANLARQTRYPDYSWDYIVWVVALGGEVGEACNVVKKLRRDSDGMPGNAGSRRDLEAALAFELADAVIYLDLVVAHLELPLGDAGFASFSDLVPWREAAPEAPIESHAGVMLVMLGRLAADDDSHAAWAHARQLLRAIDLVAHQFDIDLAAAVVSKFNAISDKLGFPDRLEAA